jgi:hypothetical protein
VEGAAERLQAVGHRRKPGGRRGDEGGSESELADGRDGGAELADALDADPRGGELGLKDSIYHFTKD